jgi:corrinoid protein of di/trimethylamine methyltransferase
MTAEQLSRRNKILAALAAAVDGMDEEAAARWATENLSAGIPPFEAITEGLSKGMAIVSTKYDQGVYFVPEILLCADAMYAAINVLRPHLKKSDASSRPPVVIGVIEGDIHDLGKNIVKLMLDAAGFPVYDLGRDVPVEKFLAKARELGSGIIAISTLMSTTMPGMKKLIDALVQAKLRGNFKVMIGGGPVSSAFAKSIGADAYGHNAMEAVRLATEWEKAVQGAKA